MSTIVIVGAGDGGRMGGINKCLLDINGKPLIEHHIDLFKDHRVVFVAGYNAEKIQQRYGDQIQVIDNTEWKDSNSAHSLYLGLQYIYPDGDITVINSDIYFSFVPDRRGFYCTPLRESIVYRDSKGARIADCQGVFRGIARLSPDEAFRYMASYSYHFKNRYWSNVMDDIDIVLTDEPIYEFDTWEEYNAFQHKRD